MRYILTTLIACIATLSVQANLIGFEEGIPAAMQAIGGSISCTSIHFKEGKQSLKWSFKKEGQLIYSLTKAVELTESRKEKAGITLWIYNDKPADDSLRWELLDANGETVYRFGFHLTGRGWRACWIGFKQMIHQPNKKQEISAWRITAPRRKGCVYLDRINFPVEKMNERTTPDLQMPYCNSLTNRNLWHWCRVWQWEQYAYAQPLPKVVTTSEKQAIALIEARLDSMLKPAKAPQKAIRQADELFRKAAISLHNDIVSGPPLVAPDELQKMQGEFTWSHIESMLSGLAYKALFRLSPEAQEQYFLVWEYALDQGFAYGSGMGTNHHYGYQVREIFNTAWLMRDAIRQHRRGNEIIATLTFWAALQETRQPCETGRDELLDSWHTLLMPKTISALMLHDIRQRIREFNGLSHWVSTSLHFTPGTIGGIKIDGTCFHHGGFYPAYATDALGALGTFIGLTNGTCWLPSLNARRVLKKALMAMTTYCNLHEWGIGICGRHPFGGSMKPADIEAFAHLALAGDLTDSREEQPREIDTELASNYLRLATRESKRTQLIASKGISKATAPQGFYVYNYGSAGIYRQHEWMVTLKGYTTDVWGAEIYTNDNRYGRYQSYGSVQIQTESTREASGYKEAGWDWNRLPGTTTIHLPWKELDSPLKGTTMAHATEDFSGSCSLQGKSGLFAMKLMERNLPRFTADFTARKSVFCFDNRLICLGSDISNSNNRYPTETTLYQAAWSADCHATGIIEQTPDCTTLTDGYRNRYYVSEGKVRTSCGRQESRHNKTRAATQGDFTTAWIDHGTAPQGEGYEYLIWIQPTEQELEATPQPCNTYQVVRKDHIAHIVYDKRSQTTGYALFEAICSMQDTLFVALPKEVLVMHSACTNEGLLHLTICSPGLYLPEKSYTTPQPAPLIDKELILHGMWELCTPCKQVSATHFVNGNEQQTRLSVQCSNGIPTECTIRRIESPQYNQD